MLFRSLLKVAENSNRAQNSGLVSFVHELLLPSKLHKTVPFNEDGRESPEPVIKTGFEEMELKFFVSFRQNVPLPLKIFHQNDPKTRVHLHHD